MQSPSGSYRTTLTRAESVAGLSPLVIVPVVLLTLYLAPVGPIASLAGSGVAVLVVVALLVVSARLRRRNRDRLRSIGFRACRRCAYPLDQLPSEGICPECGESYSHDECEKWWRLAYKEKRDLGD